MRSAGAAAAAAACFAGAIAVHAAGARWVPRPDVDRPDVLYIRSPGVARRAVLRYQGLAADVYWIRAIQHFGQEHLAPPPHVRTYGLLYPLLDLTTTLDPYFSIAYRFGAIFLGEPYPGGPGRPDLAIALLNKGLAYAGTSLQGILGWAMAPVAYVLGVPWSDCRPIGGLLGTRTVLNELIAYGELGKLKGTLQPRSFAIATFALCGFANFGSIGIQLGGIGALAPNRRADLAQLGLRALIAGTLANYLSACIAGILL